MGRKKLFLIVGPTASGKTDYSIALAKEIHSPIISCDSRQIYKELKIGTAPPTQSQLREVKHYFIHSHSIFDHYTAGRYELEAISLMSELFKERNSLVMVGGSGLYADAVCYGLDDFPAPDIEVRKGLTSRAKSEGVDSLAQELKKMDFESYNSIDISNPQRVIRALEVVLTTGKKFSSFKNFCKKEREFDVERVVIERERSELYDRINQRTDMMISMGLEAEARELFPHRGLTALKTVGYRELFDYFEGKVSFEEAIELIKRDTRRYAKRQITWFKKGN
ncbi:MAG: tRNA (adenosine(37)-N6)-dimethylallyltransferase MiaA [Bacteroidetes bacterium GWF2_41_61]|nr:MAG: tRNA (adenosine(37)-N6)-dimethylallyltransferase MiaA [Bacteroidetes bacterium GWE2_40_15]OFY27627.1 MAG: tRNA (adenosine(37)-N6)-dimethylallyltransferase MiaA [Bacteroidetes bacterium GWF2_41_61]OFY90243.1 MAG: tRNA (adenosine(37)-N6)-dimethylallyltransferase MiaA [Bacteroidetes bacterium RIFOXYA12_FULL_40_10]HBG25119.1 tRNA (adenosine(37)-N6)-dimethylallyltransferase MiaA [Rikenellaceae bacterium]HBZ24792.1 tRNA (adenosine(37)-N6)-dimethylallyltransferase MiaA [Rikenellaceae bacterium